MQEPQSAEPAQQPLSHMDALPAGTMLGEFELRGLLGVGGFGIVYRGYDHSLQRPVAIKEYLPTALVARGADKLVAARSTADAEPFQAGLKSFIAEARLLAQFDHPSLVKVYRFWEAHNTAYMAMPLYQGCTLKQARQRMDGPPPEEWLRAILWSVLEGLKVLHANDTLHRDISPDNIFLLDQGPPVLLDLGAARRALGDDARKYTAVLKVNYAPIEQYADAAGMREGPWTDLYSVAAVMHGFLRNEAPIPATVRAVKDSLPSFAKIAEAMQKHFGRTYSDHFIRALDHALALSPDQRPVSVESFSAEMRLRRPANIRNFDWRAALADGAPLPGPQDDGASTISEDFPSTQLPTEPQALAAAAEAPPTQPPRQRKRKRSKEPEKLAWLAPLLWGGFALVFAALIYWGLASRTKSVPTPAQQQAASEPASPSAVPAVSAPASAPPVLEPLKPAASAPSAAVSSVKLAPIPKPRPAKPASAAEVAKPPEPSPANEVKPDTEHRPAAPVKETAVPAAAAPVHRELCPDANFFTRPMCIYRECQKDENAKLAVCVEDRKRWEKQQQNRP